MLFRSSLLLCVFRNSCTASLAAFSSLRFLFFFTLFLACCFWAGCRSSSPGCKAALFSLLCTLGSRLWK